MNEILAASFSGLAAILFGGITVWELSKRPKKFHRKFRNGLKILAIPCALCGLYFQVSTTVHLQTYKSDLVLRYQDRYDDKLVNERGQSALAILEFLNKGSWQAVTNQDNLDAMEDMLGFYDELGFYWKHGEISSEVLYEHFYYDMRVHCQSTLGYIHNDQKTDSPTDWENVEPLLAELTSIESKRTGKSLKDCVWSDKVLRENLVSEVRHAKLNLPNDPDNTQITVSGISNANFLVVKNSTNVSVNQSIVNQLNESPNTTNEIIWVSDTNRCIVLDWGTVKIAVLRLSAAAEKNNIEVVVGNNGQQETLFPSTLEQISYWKNIVTTKFYGDDNLAGATFDVKYIPDISETNITTSMFQVTTNIVSMNGFLVIYH
jgi:hypothetical protein